ncbi:MAG: hypothetical protein ACR2HE_03230 [Casimicrobiaceae bacterium]
MTNESDNEAKEPDSSSTEQPERLMLQRREGETEGRTLAHYFLADGVNAAQTIYQTQTKLLPVEITPLLGELERQSKAVNDRDLSGGQTILTQQAATLDALFHKLARYGLRCMEEGYNESADTYLKLGFKAQAQSRQCQEAIGEIQNPRQVAFVKAEQANIAAGHQQVNNNARADEKTIPPNEQSGAGHGIRTHAGTPAPAIGSNPPVATVAAVDGTAIARGQGSQLEERRPRKRATAPAKSRKAAKGG